MNKLKANENILVMDPGDHGSSVVHEELLNGGKVRCLGLDELDADTSLVFGQKNKLIITSENVLHSVLQKLADAKRVEVVTTLKNKFRCREMLAGIYPDFYFRLVDLKDIEKLELPPGRQFIIKPNKGYFATAIKVVDSSSDLAAVKTEIVSEVKRNAEVFPESVLSDSEVIVEEFIEGEEYAVDMFFNESGEPVIINIYHHPMPANRDYLHVLYYTCKEIFDRLYDPLIDWFRKVNETLDITAFPIHAEFRYNKGKIVPIELNPIRFGGDGLVDLAYHAFGFNPFMAYYEDTRLDWGSIWQGRENKYYAWVMGYNGTDVDLDTHRPDLRQFQSLFSRILSDTLLNYKYHLGFSVMYVEESDPAKIFRLVDVEFREFFLKSGAFTENVFKKLFKSGVLVHADPSEQLWEKGAVEDYVLLVLEGSLDVFDQTPDGQDFQLDVVGPKAVAGEYAVMGGMPRLAAVRAGAEGCAAVRISGQAFRQLLREAPEVFEDLYWQQQLRIRRLNEHISKLESALFNTRQ